VCGQVLDQAQLEGRGQGALDPVSCQPFLDLSAQVGAVGLPG
jgi:hypothetical protein